MNNGNAYLVFLFTNAVIWLGKPVQAGIRSISYRSCVDTKKKRGREKIIKDNYCHAIFTVFTS